MHKALQLSTALMIASCLIAPTLQADDISLERLMMMHDVMPDEALTLDAELILPEPAQAKTLATTQPSIPETLTLEGIAPPIRVLIDVRSNHSDGMHDFNTLVELAKKRHIEALAFTEHDRYSIRFGIDPMPHILGYSQEHPSLYETGLQQFFDDLKAIQQQNTMTLFAGTESTPGYYWQGIPFKNFSLHNAERHLITLGGKTAEQVENLSSYTLEHGYGNKEISLMFWFVFIFGLIFTLLQRRKRGIALLVAGSFIAFITTWLMKAEVNPDQAFIQSAQEQDMFVIWTHPGTLSGVREGPMGVWLDTPPYSQEVFKSPTADAFAAVYGDTDVNTQPSGVWDQFMMDYLSGYRAKPIWAVAAGDYHEEGQSGEFLGNFPMDVWAKSANEDDILDALKQGKMASWHMNKNTNIAVKALFLEYTNIKTGKPERLLAGDEAVISADIQLIAAIQNLDTQTQSTQLQGQWIVDGQVVSQINLSTEISETTTPTKLHLSEGRHVIRFQIPPQKGVRLETNPFLVQVRK